MQYACKYVSPLGGMTLACEDAWLTGVWFDDQTHFADTLSDRCEWRMTPVLERTCAWLDGYFRGQEPDFMPPIRPAGTPFRRAVWEILRTIPYGQTTTYKRIAGEIARRGNLPAMSAQAVGGAVGHNPVSILIPCHRVVGSDGSLTGYAGGLSRKARLLALEGADPFGGSASATHPAVCQPPPNDL